MRTIVVAFVLAFATTAQVVDTQLTDDIHNFHKHWDKYIRTYFGCGQEAHSTAECNPALATIDYAEWIKARKAAKKLFKFVEEKHGKEEKH